MKIRSSTEHHSALRVAARGVVAEIEGEAVRVPMSDGGRWFDLRPMLDENVHCDEALDLARESIDFLLFHGLATRPLVDTPHMLRLEVERLTAMGVLWCADRKNHDA
jgi:hypothetical protein